MFTFYYVLIIDTSVSPLKSKNRLVPLRKKSLKMSSHYPEINALFGQKCRTSKFSNKKNETASSQMKTFKYGKYYNFKRKMISGIHMVKVVSFFPKKTFFNILMKKKIKI